MNGEARSERERIDALETPLLARAATPYVALSGAANVIMQLSWPQVGYGVKDSPVADATLFDNPRRRRRTTVGYLAVAVHGTASERAAFRRATTVSHAQVRSAPGTAPVYRALDPVLQRWVGSCIYRGFEDAYEAVFGPLGRDAEAFYAQGVVFGAMLQMPPALWPADRAAFEDYWRDGLRSATIDDAVRDFLMRVVRMEYLSERISRRVAARRTWMTTGFLPPELRAAMQLPWTDDDEAGFRRFTSRVAAVIRRSPHPVQQFPFNTAMVDVRRRLAADVPLF